MTANTINDLFYLIVERNSAQVMLYKQTVKWIPISAKEFYRDTVGIARSLASWGIRKGDRVAILSENRAEWAAADFGSLLLGAVDVPIYTTLTPEQIAWIVNDSGARVIFVSTVEQMKKVFAIKDQTKLEKVVVMDYVGIPEAIPMHRLMHNGPTSRDAEFDAAARTVAPDDLASIIYTSGTTGRSKGAMLTHGNLMSNVNASLNEFDIHERDVAISYLPLSHITARHVDYGLLFHGSPLAYCPSMEKLPQTMLEIRPTFFVGVPRVYEKIFSQVQAKVAGGLKRKMYNWAISVGREHRAETLAGKPHSSLAWTIADKILFSKVRAAMGGRGRIYISGGAPLGRELAEWYADIGIRIHEGYGLTETSPVIAVNTPKNHKIGTVGKPLPNVEVTIAGDGELLVRGPSIFKGYWNQPDETLQAFEDGWFKTGDVARLDEDGYLAIIDRKKDLIKTSGGKFIAPQPIENSLKLNPFVAEATVSGDRRKFACAIISPHIPSLEEWARAHGVAYQSLEDLVSNPKVQTLYESIVEDVNSRLAQFEKIKKVLVVPHEYSVSDGSLTPTLKLRRRIVEERYKQQLDELYKEPSEAAAG